MNRTTRQSFAALALLVATTPALTAQARPPSAPVWAQPQSSTQARVLAVGDKVQVSWSGSWYNATVLELGQGTYKVRYDGWSSDWDEWVAPSRMRLTSGGAIAAPTAASPTSPAGAKTAAPPAPARPTASATPAKPATPAPAPAPKILSASPVGRYACRTWDASQVNRVGEFVLRANGEYQDLFYKGKGHYRYDATTRLIAFTSGPQKTSAKVSFNPEGHAGKGHITFDYGNGARLDCYREALG